MVAVAALLAGCGSASTPAAASPHPSATPAEPSASPAGPSPSPTLLVTPAPTARPRAAVVPVADFRTTAISIDRTGVEAILAGTSKRFKSLELVSDQVDEILALLGLDAAPVTHLVIARDAVALASDLAAGSSLLGFLAASEIGPGMRALPWEGKSLFGTAGVRSLADWPLQVTLDPSTAVSDFDPSRTWTVVAAGDVMLDRGVYNQVVNKGKGVDYPFAGGTVAITSRYCCSSFGWVMPRSKSVVAAPTVRDLFLGADLSMVNLEGPAPATSLYHTEGKLFSFDQKLLVGLKNAGIDVVSLANNHIGNAGKQGIRDTMAALDSLGIAHGGVGANDVAARAPVLFDIDGVKVAFMAYDAIAPSYAAGPNLLGTAELSAGTAPADIRAARAAGAQVVIVFPHWGVEYRATPTSTERTWAHEMIDAGADLVIGSHSHYSGAMESYKGKPIWYSLGNFVFDQTWSEQTEEGLTLELSFNGPTLVQAWLHPTLDVNGCQPNLLDAASGQVVLDQVFGASRGLLSW